MAWRRRYPMRPLWDEFDQMMAEMEDRFQRMFQGAGLPTPSEMGSRVLPALRGEFRVDVREHEDEVVVVADLPGVEKEGVQLRLVDPNLLLIKTERRTETEETGEKEGYYMRERQYGSMSRTVALPVDVTEEASTASFKNGVLEVHLKKLVKEEGTHIPIE
ncbi:MAG TPA: Hsp20/alpha crystallin family protein [Methanoculleus sp.]|nr:Hsp20/alpha crystallin family protein [Methanoculleus sp.]